MPGLRRVCGTGCPLGLGFAQERTHHSKVKAGFFRERCTFQRQNAVHVSEVRAALGVNTPDCGPSQVRDPETGWSALTGCDFNGLM